MKTPISYYGGKQKMVRHILPLIPKHDIYCEPFCGGAALFFAKEPVTVEIINDLNTELINLYKVIKHNFQDLYKEIEASLHSRQQHRHARIIYDNPDLFPEVKRAWAVWVMANISYASIMGGAWAYDRRGNTTLNIKNKIIAFTQELQQRLKNVQIECNEALKVIASRDTENTFTYCDPPYFNSNCGHYAGYKESDFIALMDTLSRLKGKFLLSSYPSDALCQYTKKYGCKQVCFNQKVSINNSGKLKTEVLTTNYSIEKSTL